MSPARNAADLETPVLPSITSETRHLTPCDKNDDPGKEKVGWGGRGGGAGLHANTQTHF